VRETPPPTANAQQNQMFAMFGIAPPQMEGEDLSSAVFGDVPVKVTLAVQFEIVK